MKNIMKYLLLFVVVLAFLTACSQEKKNSVPEKLQEDIDAQYIGDRTGSGLHIEPLDEYNKYLKTMPKLDYFVPYEQFSEIGEFESFVCLTDARYDDYSKCFYDLWDENGIYLGLYVYWAEKHPRENKTTVSEVDNLSDLRQIDAKGEHVVYYDLEGIWYKYIDGELLSISWCTDKSVFILMSETGFLTGEELDPNSFVAKIVNQETAVSTIAEFNRKVSD